MSFGDVAAAVNVIIGFCIGILSGCFGIGGAFILTPTLNALGIPMVHAVGTGLVFTLGVSSYGGFKHFRQGNISVRTVGCIALFSVAGIQCAQRLVQYWEHNNAADYTIRMVYIVMLLAMGLLTLGKKGQSGTMPGAGFWGKMPRPLRYPVRMEDGREVPLAGLAAIGFLVGLLQGIMGVGGGFVLVPVFIFVLGMKPHTAVGSSLAIVFVSSLYASALYVYYGKVVLTTAAVMIAGSLLGANLGVAATKNMPPAVLQRVFAVFLLLSSLGIVFKQLSWHTAALVYMLAVTGAMALFVVVRYTSVFRFAGCVGEGVGYDKKD